MDNYEILEEIGSGAFSKVFKVKRISDSKILVSKIIDYGSMQDKEK